MKFRVLVAAMLLAGNVHAAAPEPAPALSTPTVQAMIDQLQAGFDGQCREAERKLAAAKPEDATVAEVVRNMACTCVEKALNAGFPANMRSETITPGAFLARMGGAMNVCVAVTAREQIVPPCDAGVDPFSSTASSPDVAEARCSCARAELDRMIAANPADEADKAAAEYVRQGTPGLPSTRDVAPLVFLRNVQATCAPSTVGK